MRKKELKKASPGNRLLVAAAALGSLVPLPGNAQAPATPPAAPVQAPGSPEAPVGGESVPGTVSRERGGTAGMLAAGPVSLQEAILVAHQNHGRIAVAEESVEASRQRVRQARTGTLPTVTGQLGYAGGGTTNFGGTFGREPTRTVIGPNGVPQRVTADRDTVAFNQGLQPRLGLNYNIYDGGLTRHAIRQARANVESNLANLGAVRNNLELEVTTNYLLQLRSERLLELRRAQEQLAAEQLRAVEANIRVGAAAEADRALVLSEYRNRQVDRITAENEVLVSANALRNSMGLPVGPPLSLVTLQENLEPLSPLARLQDQARRQRPEVVQAEAQVRAAQAGVSIARTRRRPRLDTNFGFNLAPNDPLTRGDWSFGAAVSLPIWDAGLTHAQEREAKTGVSANLAQLEQLRRDVAAEVQEAYLNLVNARERLAASRLAQEAAQVNLEVTTARYERGIQGVDVVDLIQAQVQFATASNNAIQALYDIFLAQAQLDRAVGR